MANTVTQITLFGGGDDKDIYRLIHILSDGSEETDLVIYDNSTLVANVAKGTLQQVWIHGDASTIRLEWDQSTDSPIGAFNPISGNHYDFRSFGGIPNPGATGATGDIVLTTATLDSTDEVTIILHVTQN